GDAIEPSGELRGGFIFQTGAIDADENILRQFLGNGPILHHTAEVLDNHIPIAFEEQAEALGVVSLSADHQLRIDVNSRCHKGWRHNPVATDRDWARQRRTGIVFTDADSSRKISVFAQKATNTEIIGGRT